MAELFRNAWQLGWLRYTNSGKLTAVLLASLLFLWLSGKWKRQKVLFSYSALMSLFCIVPVTAMVLMLYQTRFYDYEWIWSLVPMTIVCAWAGTALLEETWGGFSLSSWKKGLPVTLLLLAILALCGGLGKNVIDRNDELARRQQASEVVDKVLEDQSGDICLWAPREILEYARAQSGALRLIYGRNMWDQSLNAYAYDTYPREIQELYLWMENVEPTGTALVEDADQGELLLEGEACMTIAAQAGVNCILLPESLDAVTVEALAKALGGRVDRLDAYYLLTR
ncbi:MAG: hypothetical protein J1E01_07025 [Acetatifactor sp.]|nr:hypothetical protein [Acetatifactor sp.]